MKKPFIKVKLKDNEIKKVNAFAINSANTQKENRSGGSQSRSINQIIEDTKEGKYAEYGVYNFLKKYGLAELTKPNLCIVGRSKWDNGIDIKMKVNDKDFEKIIEVKSSSIRSRLLLITANDLEYNKTENDIDFEHTKGAPDYLINVKVDVKNKITYIMGFLSKKDLLMFAKNKNNYFSKGELIPKTKVPLDADNYIWVNPNEKDSFIKYKHRGKKLPYLEEF